MAPTVALIGVHGHLFNAIHEAITSSLFKDKYNLPLRALTRDPSKEEHKKFVEYYSINYEDPSSLDNALDGVDVAINLVSPGQVWDVILQSIVRKKVPVYITSDFGCDGRKVLQKSFLDFKDGHAEKAKAAGVPKVVRFFTGLFQEFLKSPALGPTWKEHTATILGDGTGPVTATSIRDIGRAVASIAYRPASEIPDVVRIQGDQKTLNEIIAIYEKLTSNKVKVTYDPLPADSLDQLADADLLPALRIFAANPQTESFYFPETQNELVNPGLWKWQSIEELFINDFGEN
ncbi:hypothetical protein V1525DRAFT_391450 [Lipomyces kononenkoae]|uniref:Uncharacterized protein n=1 Tax=Lipomyces kononenkoae TaxID=34357 RepID=A0ACC3SST3_LIPKO